MESLKHPGNYLLLALFLINAAVNWSALQVESSIQMAYVFLFPAPFLLCAGVLAAQLLSGQQLFLWRSVVVFLFGLFVATVCNVYFLTQIAGSV
ncbi:hypothetical protein [Planctomicrobium piriforme]|uniref:Uncharacterized protein n=1 Tax=Planctomicrobium piriforme TaxID=1576369 RepID=A0A1I3K3G0_9PLAN|nr:hypothetical protein [Planctomicrobium piriforme]SFI66848.1 hypothetical protein SAMN05421753_111101 [Planctomicrobium piriforme]